ncbi:MAG: hypothetical protein JGK26_17450 [Microcoleus sp. PH2017_27_LUM_O_A]|nr:hypothetical protein [Microcoleus sp. PH2017_27_LUM_O_A]
MTESAIDFSPLPEDFRYETGVFNPCRTAELTNNTNTAFHVKRDRPSQDLSIAPYHISSL